MELSRQEYPALLVSALTLFPISLQLNLNDPQTFLQPSQAVSVLNDRVRLISKVNSDVADWLSVRFVAALVTTYLTYIRCRNDGALKRPM